jgi:hypothetical protein
MSNGGSITPFFTIWTEPRATIRQIVETDPTLNVIPLAAIGPALNALARQWSAAISNSANLSVLWPLRVVASVVIQAVLGIVFLYIFGAIFKWSGALLGGVASRIEVRCALAWSQVPAIAAEIILVIAVLSGVPMPQPTPGKLPHIDPASYKILFIESVFGIWGLVVSLKTMGEVHRFSAWRALAAIVIPPLIVIVAIGFVILVGSRVTGHH